LVLKKIIQIILNLPSVPQHQEPTPLLFSTKEKYIFLEDMEVSATLESLSMISTALILRPNNGRRSFQATMHQKVGVDTPLLLVKVKSSFMVDGTPKCNLTTSCNSILRRKNGMIQIAFMRYIDGTIQVSLSLLFQHGSSSSLVESKQSIKKVLQELLDNM
jgi:hypothetical protein